MKNAKSPPATKSRVYLIPFLLACILIVLFWKSFAPGYVHFSNDGPLAQINAAYNRLPMAFTGTWGDLNGIGGNAGASPINIDGLISWALGPVNYSKIFQPTALFILGLGAWTFFRQLKLSPLAAALGGLAVMLNSAYFSTACWGVASQQIAVGMTYFALALVVSNTPETPWHIRWLRIALAGLAVGMNVAEGADNGAIYSLFIAAFVLVKALLEEGRPIWMKAGSGILRIAVIAIFAAFIAAQTINALIGVAIVGVAGGGQTPEERAKQWDFATQWSEPKLETLGLIVPGLFGYRMDTPKDATWVGDGYRNGNYWGGVGRDPNIDRFFDKTFVPGDEVTITVNNQSATLQIAPDGTLNLPYLNQIKAAGLSGLKLKETIEQAYAAQRIQASVRLPSDWLRFSGGGTYEGILVILIAIWAIAQAFRRRDSVFSDAQRKIIWFWTAICIWALLMSFGRFGFFDAYPYRWFYELPYASSMRNPTKFLSIFSWAFLIIFAYGIHGLSRRYLEVAGTNVKSSIAQFQSWWKNVRGFDRKWTISCGIAFAASVIAWFVYLAQKPALVKYLEAVQAPGDPQGLADFSISQAGWFLLFFAAAIVLCVLAIAGIFSGKRARIGGFLLGALLVIDLGRADLPWIVHWNYPVKYDVDVNNPKKSLNPIINFLAEKSYENRVMDLPWHGVAHLPQYDDAWEELYRIEWIQQLFPYYNVQSLDYVQNPRPAADMMAFSYAMVRSPLLNWELSNNRYFLGPMAIQVPQSADPNGEMANVNTLEFLNDALDRDKKRFQIVQRFDVVPKAGVEQIHELEQFTVETNDNGGCALFEFTGALPRAKLYSNWQTNTPEELKTFSTNGFDELDMKIFASADTNDFLTLKKLSAPAFDPWQTVLVSGAIPASTAGTNENSGTVEFKSYSAKEIVLDARAATTTVLLLNDKYDPHWRAFVDGKETPIFRANFIMRGVYLPAGEHTVEFYFYLPSRPLYITIAALVVAALLGGILFFATRRDVTATGKSA